MSAREDVTFLVGSESRVSIFRALTDGPCRPTDLASRCECARETAQRTLAGFRERGWVQKSDGMYCLTLGGEMVFERYDRLVDTVECADRMSEFLIHAGEMFEDVPLDVLQQLTVTTAVDNDPHAPINRYLSVLGDEPVDRFRGVTPIVSRIFNEAAQEVIGPQTEMELVIDQAVLERSIAEYPDAYELGKELDQFSLYVVEEDLEIGLLLVDGHGVVASHDDDGNIVALVDGDATDVVRWVEGLYEPLRANASPAMDDESPLPRDTEQL